MNLVRSLLSWHALLSLLIGFMGIGIMILVHELGHMISAKACKVRVESLSIGFGPIVASWNGKDTRYCIRLILFGGACKMAGGDDLRAAARNKSKSLDKCEDGSIYAVSALKRLLIYFCGPLANVLFAVFCYVILIVMPSVVQDPEPRIVLASDYGQLYEDASSASADAGLATGDLVLSVNGIGISNYSQLQETLSSLSSEGSVLIETRRGTFQVHPENGLFGILPYRQPVVGSVNFTSEESKAGLKRGDLILSANGRDVTNMFDILEEAASCETLSLEVQRKNTTRTISFPSDGSLHFTLMQESGVQKGESLPYALRTAFRECLTGIRTAVQALGSVLSGAKTKSEELSGTFGASQSIGMLTTTGFSAGFFNGMRIVFYLLANVSISLAVANMLPIPALDGGLMLISLAEMLAHRQLRPRTYVVLQTIGMTMVFAAIALMALL